MLGSVASAAPIPRGVCPATVCTRRLFSHVDDTWRSLSHYYREAPTTTFPEQRPNHKSAATNPVGWRLDIRNPFMPATPKVDAYSTVTQPMPGARLRADSHQVVVSVDLDGVIVPCWA